MATVLLIGQKRQFIISGNGWNGSGLTYTTDPGKLRVTINSDNSGTIEALGPATGVTVTFTAPQATAVVSESFDIPAYPQLIYTPGSII